MGEFTGAKLGTIELYPLGGTHSVQFLAPTRDP